MLALTKVEDRHHSSLLVLRWVSLEDLSDDGLILLIEFERNIGVVVGGVAVLVEPPSVSRSKGAERGHRVYVAWPYHMTSQRRLTTLRESLRRDAETESARICEWGRAIRVADRRADLTRRGVILLAILKD